MHVFANVQPDGFPHQAFDSTHLLHINTYYLRLHSYVAMGKRQSRATARSKKKSKTERPPSIYEPLPEGGFIRVLVLQPGICDDEIVCHLEIQSYESSKKYSAISYVWGDHNVTVNILCNSIPVQITSSLADALRRFRSPQKTKRLWADALCINQDDDEEKGHQVTHMGKVYEHATCVLVWLGLDVDNVAEGCFKTIEEINKYFEKQLEENNNSLWGLLSLKAPHPVPTSLENWLPVHRLMELPWFRRVWTVQECSLAMRCRMFWGQASIDIAEVISIAVWYVEHGGFRALVQAYGIGSISLPRTLFANAYCYFRQVQSWQCSRPVLRKHLEQFPSSTFCCMICGLDELKATDERDFVYALLGCVFAKDDCGLPLIQVDYAAPLRKVYYDIAESLLRSTREGPWLLSAVTRTSRAPVTQLIYPTWIPQWNFPLQMLANPAYHFESGGPPNRFVATISKSACLQISGFIFDKVIWRTDQIQNKNFLQVAQLWTTSNRATNEPYLNRLWRVLASAAIDFGLPLHEEDFTRTLVINRGNRWGGHHETDIQAYRKLMQLSIEKPWIKTKVVVTDEERSYAKWVAHAMCFHTSWRCLFLTRNGRIGLGPSMAMEVGDLCCIVMGATVPFLLTPGNEGRYRLVEECYIHGVMGGELLDQYEPTTIVIE
jgi:hypothetical protein